MSLNPTGPGGMFGALLGGLDLSAMMPELPCAICVLAHVDPPEQGVTVAAGTLVCRNRDHIADAFTAGGPRLTLEELQRFRDGARRG